jgi:DnaJ-class molecular chaperone
MAKTSLNKLVCPACNGNGYRKIMKDASSKISVEIDCEACDNQGEIKNDEKNI